MPTLKILTNVTYILLTYKEKIKPDYQTLVHTYLRFLIDNDIAMTKTAIHIFMNKWLQASQTFLTHCVLDLVYKHSNNANAWLLKRKKNCNGVKVVHNLSEKPSQAPISITRALKPKVKIILIIGPHYFLAV